MKDERLHLRLDRVTRAELGLLAGEFGLSMSALVVQAVRYYAVHLRAARAAREEVKEL